jgi:hypothetical protein
MFEILQLLPQLRPNSYNNSNNIYCISNELIELTSQILTSLFNLFQTICFEFEPKEVAAPAFVANSIYICAYLAKFSNQRGKKHVN